MNNRLKEFEELLLDNTLLKMQIKPWEIKPQVEGVVANWSRIYRGANSRKHGINLF
jgi:hypothetical protein